jgi:hypothetical protein
MLNAECVKRFALSICRSKQKTRLVGGGFVFWFLLLYVIHHLRALQE